MRRFFLALIHFSLVLILLLSLSVSLPLGLLVSLLNESFDSNLWFFRVLAPSQIERLSISKNSIELAWQTVGRNSRLISFLCLSLSLSHWFTCYGCRCHSFVIYSFHFILSSSECVCAISFRGCCFPLLLRRLLFLFIAIYTFNMCRQHSVVITFCCTTICMHWIDGRKIEGMFWSFWFERMCVSEKEGKNSCLSLVKFFHDSLETYAQTHITIYFYFYMAANNGLVLYRQLHIILKQLK